MPKNVKKPTSTKKSRKQKSPSINNTINIKIHPETKQRRARSTSSRTKQPITPKVNLTPQVYYRTITEKAPESTELKNELVNFKNHFDNLLLPSRTTNPTLLLGNSESMPAQLRSDDNLLHDAIKKQTHDQIREFAMNNMGNLKAAVMKDMKYTPVVSQLRGSYRKSEKQKQKESKKEQSTQEPVTLLNRVEEEPTLVINTPEPITLGHSTGAVEEIVDEEVKSEEEPIEATEKQVITKKVAKKVARINKKSFTKPLEVATQKVTPATQPDTSVPRRRTVNKASEGKDLEEIKLNKAHTIYYDLCQNLNKRRVKNYEKLNLAQINELIDELETTI